MSPQHGTAICYDRLVCLTAKQPEFLLVCTSKHACAMAAAGMHSLSSITLTASAFLSVETSTMTVSMASAPNPCSMTTQGLAWASHLHVAQAVYIRASPLLEMFTNHPFV